MYHVRIAVIIILMTTLLRNASALDIVVKGQPKASIVIPDEKLAVEQASAEELQYHVRRATGANLPITTESGRPAGDGYIFLGATQAGNRVGLDTKALKPNGYRIALVGGNLYLRGDDSVGEVFWIQHGNYTRVGTLFAVYEFVEKTLKAKWLWPGELGTVVPKVSDLRVPQWKVTTGSPPFIHTRWRDGGVYMAGAAGWASQENRSVFLNEEGKWLRRHRFAMGLNMDMAHSFTDWWDRFSKDHPEYFNLLPDGTRRSDTTYHGGHKTLIAMCVGEPELRKQKVADWGARRTPHAPNVDASENDTCGKCVCEKCLALDEPDPESKTPFQQRVAVATERFKKNDADWWTVLGSLSDRYARFYLGVQKEAEKIDPQAVVMGYAYANYVKAPLKTKLNERIIIGIVSALMYPWTQEKQKAFRDQWQGWSATGARMFLRPNYMLDGHNMPVFFARKLGEDFSFAASHGLIGTDFDSLTGQWATQGPNLYMLARLHDNPRLPVAQVIDEYYSGFGKAKEPVRAYFTHWEKVSNSVSDKVYEAADLHWSRLYRDADRIFTRPVMAQGRELLKKARSAAKDDAEAERRVAFLEKGLKNAELTLAVQVAFRKYQQDGDIHSYVQTIKDLDVYRASIEGDLVANMAYLQWSEGLTWDRSLLKLMANPGTRLEDPWKFAWDAKDEGTKQKWFTEDFDDSTWLNANTVHPWEQQEVGKKWKAQHGVDYDGIAWYRKTFSVAKGDKPQQVRLLFGAVDEACNVWVNGKLVCARPYPYKGNPDSWREAFEVDITEVVRYDSPNTVVVRVEDNVGAGGAWKPVWLLTSVAPMTDDQNLLKDGGFERKADDWKPNLMCGTIKLARDETQSRNGTASSRIVATSLGTAEDQAKFHTRSWARWYQPSVAVEAGKTYRLRVWVKTSDNFNGMVKVWVTGTKSGTAEARFLNTEALWKEVTLDNIVPTSDQVSVYLNLFDGLGTVWFDDAELVETAVR